MRGRSEKAEPGTPECGDVPSDSPPAVRLELPNEERSAGEGRSDRALRRFSCLVPTMFERPYAVTSPFCRQHRCRLSDLVHDGPSAYASLVAPPIGILALLFEAVLKSPYEGIVFRKLSVGDFVK